MKNDLSVENHYLNEQSKKKFEVDEEKAVKPYVEKIESNGKQVLNTC